MRYCKCYCEANGFQNITTFEINGNDEPCTSKCRKDYCHSNFGACKESLICRNATSTNGQDSDKDGWQVSCFNRETTKDFVVVHFYLFIIIMLFVAAATKPILEKIWQQYKDRVQNYQLYGYRPFLEQDDDDGFGSKTSAYLKRLTKVQSFKGKGLVSRKMIDVIRSVPPVEITSDMKKIKGVSRRTLRNNSLGLFLPKIIYPEDEWRERLRVEVGRSPFRMALYAPRSFYDSSEDLMGISAKGQEEGTNWIERALDKQTEFMEMGEGSVSPEEAFEKAKTWLLSELEAHHATNFIPKETLDSYYKDVVESESRIVKLNALPEEDDLRGKSVLPDEDGGIGENDEILNLLEDGIAGDNLDLAEMKKMFKDSESSKVSNE